MAGRSACTIYVGNLPLDVKEWEIEDLFYKYGGILDIELKLPPHSLGYCFVEFEDPLDAEDAIRGLNLLMVVADNLLAMDMVVVVVEDGLVFHIDQSFEVQLIGSSSLIFYAVLSIFRIICRMLEMYVLLKFTVMEMIRKLDDSEFQNSFSKAYIRVESYYASPHGAGSQNQSRSPSRSPRSNHRSLSKSRSPPPAKLSISRSRSN
ncbi:hypothetical protein SLEP1_g33865 [Rubroshorea leprosula]|uniref:RRM domain-containing protein n=1 Tax=Rubroshorea leprosula TaxID=152421 RepID=A0AAV5KI71_9ROSI|nr:hypothetical protein SLEP1_g33865 [Rubroshorea leprosula]